MNNIVGPFISSLPPRGQEKLFHSQTLKVYNKRYHNELIS